MIVVNSSVASPVKRFTLTGDTLSLATRLDDLAQPRQTIISDTLHNIIDHLFHCERLGSVRVRHQHQPINVWQVIDFKPLDENLNYPLIGRKSELQQFMNMLNDCVQTNSGRMVYICGEAGIGKTRLAEEFKVLAGRDGFACHQSLVLDFGVALGEDAIGSLVRNLLLTDSPYERVDENVIENLTENELILPEQQIYIYDLLRLPLSGDNKKRFEALDHGTRIQGLHSVVTHLTTQRAKERPVFLLFEDLHWADRDTLECIANVAAGIAHAPVVLTVTTRPENEPLSAAWRSKMGNTTLLSYYLAPLHDSEAMELAKTLAKGDVTDYQAYIKRAQGNPLFLEQLIRNSGDIDHAQLPPSLQSLVQARLDQLSAKDRLAARAASIIGQRFSPPLLRHLMDNPDYDCHRLVQYQLVYPHDNDLLFAHALIRDGIYSSLLETQRQELHLRAASWYAQHDKILRAEHLDRAGSPEVASAYLAAAEEQAQLYHYDKAIRLLDQALRVAHEPDLEYTMTALLGDVYNDMGKLAEANTAYQQALQHAQTHAQRCRVWIGLALGYDIEDQYEAALATLNEAQTAAENNGLTSDLAQIHYQRGNLLFPRGCIDSCRHEHRRALHYAQQADSPRHEAQALSGLGDAEYAAGHMISAYQYFGSCLRLCERFGYGRIEAANRFMLGTVRIYLNELDEALQDSLDSAEAATRVGHVRAEIVSRLTACWILIDRCQLDRAMEQIEAGLKLTQALGAKRFAPFLNESKARVVMAQGDRYEALAIAEEAMRITRDTGINFIGPWLLGTIAAATDDSQQRQSALREAEDLLRQGCVGHNYYQFYRTGITIALRQRKWDEAARYAECLDDYTKAEPNPWARFNIRLGRALSALGWDKYDPSLLHELAELKNEAEQTGFLAQLPLIDAGLRQINVSQTVH